MVLYNLKKTTLTNKYELEFTNSDIIIAQSARYQRINEPNKDIPLDYSLRSYCEVFNYFFI